MREILFRGKRVDNGEWVEGFYYIATSGYAGSDEVIGKPCHMITTGRWQASGAYGERNELAEHKVTPESIGQFTSLTDKNGKRIYEGDIVKHYNNSDDGFDIGALYWDGTFLQWKRTSIGNFHNSSFTYMMSHSCEYEVIGNIHDNPKLLEAE